MEAILLENSPVERRGLMAERQLDGQSQRLGQEQ
jgi:hypothetical protein